MKRVVQTVLSPVTVIAALGISGAACAVYGVHVLAGFGWALLAAGAFLLFFAALISKGLNNG